MDSLLVSLACASLVAWAVLLTFRHGFWRCDQRLKVCRNKPEHWPSVVALVPARNEEATVAQCLGALAGQDYPGPFSIVLINDASTDRTAEIAHRVSGNRAIGGHSVGVLDAEPLVPGWAGKLWALQHGVDHALKDAPAAKYYWFTDADIVHAPDTLRRLVAKAESEDLAMVSLMARLPCASPWERLLVPAFIFFFQMLYPFRAINSPAHRLAGAAGGCILLSARALEEAGGLKALKDRLIDDCALGALIKRSGHNIWLGLADSSRSLRGYPALGEFWRMVARSAFVQLKHSGWLLIGSVAGMVVAFLSAPAIVVTYPFHENPVAACICAVSWASMSVAYMPTVRYQGLPAMYSLLLTPAAFLYILMTIDSARCHWMGRGPHWKDRAYELK